MSESIVHNTSNSLVKIESLLSHSKLQSSPFKLNEVKKAKKKVQSKTFIETADKENRMKTIHEDFSNEVSPIPISAFKNSKKLEKTPVVNKFNFNSIVSSNEK
tara:strand:- start:153 stop:461 length:309 start_codon:yes stop_codon:yes gene_type:complete